ncbi:MAG: hypothetical protein LN413_05980 [Candidatus Thermoplasmatota archaeon]|nr:hypothetical protein [Candidatus Thermoplasmatota archaeon]
MTEVDRGTILQEALKDLHRNETFERALGRILRRHGKGYKEYVEIMGAVRAQVNKEGIELLEAARRQSSDG